NSYQKEIRQKILANLTIAKRLAGLVYSRPGWFYHLLRGNPYLLKIYFDMISGKNSYTRVMQEVWRAVLKTRLHG
ncbi:MAG TPA: hypothetical protein GXX29_01350, partial [Firmicutes bacterium]|nr:hypothetical protein [Bacillota bacterium]